MKVNKLKKVCDKMFLLHLIIIVALAIICLYPIKKFDFPAVLNDEFGYWSNAVSIIGYDWKQLISETPYYSWGYSIWLVPLGVIIKDFHILYKLAVVLNVFFLSVSYFCCYYIAKKVFFKNRKIELAIVSFLVIIYPSNIVYAQVTWSESLLYMLMWVATVLIFSLEENYKFYKVIIYIVILGYMYTVHQRSIGIILVGICSILWLSIKKGVSIWKIIFPVVVLSICYLVNSIVKNIQLDYLWGNSEISLVNNVSLNSTIIGGYIERALSEIGDLTVSALGKVFCLIIATGTTIAAGFYYCIKNIIVKKEKYVVSYFFVLFSLVAMLGICALQTVVFADRKDIIVYSRYMENALGPILLISFLGVINKVEKVYVAILFGGIFALASVYKIYSIIKVANGGFNTVCSPVLGAFFEKSDSSLEKIFLQMFLAFIIIVLFVSIILLLHKKMQRTICFCVLFSVFYLWVGYYAETYVLDWRNTLEKNIVVVKDLIVDQFSDWDIYYIKDLEVDRYSVNPKYLQFMIPQKSISVMDTEDINMIDSLDKSLILINSDSDLFINNMQIVYETEMLKVYCTND